jgi:hypothetical protein
VTEPVLIDFSSPWTMLFFVFWLMCERTMRTVRRQNYLTQRRLGRSQAHDPAAVLARQSSRRNSTGADVQRLKP